MELPKLSPSHGLWKQHTPTLDPEPTPFLLIPHGKRQAYTMKKNKTGEGDRKRKDAGAGGGARGALALSPPPTEGDALDVTISFWSAPCTVSSCGGHRGRTTVSSAVF